MPVRFSAEVEKAIAEVCPPRDAFDATDFDPVEYLNSRFPDEASLQALPTFITETQSRLRQSETELLKAVEAQAANGATADSDLHHGREAVAKLYDRVTEIKAKAAQSETTVKGLCQHIRELDIAKTNLTVSINTLRSVQLWMLQLQALSTSFEKRRYVQCRDALQEAKKYQTQFDAMKNLPKIKELNDKQTLICRQIEYFIRNTIFGDITLEAVDENVMSEACAIVDLMGHENIKKIRERFIDRVLETYVMRFKRGTEDATLERTERRYVYMRTMLAHHHSTFTNVFPRAWCVPQELGVTFCLRTKQELDYQLQESAGRVDVVVLTYVLQKTIDFERDLTQMMAWKDDFPGRDELPVYRYNGLILSAFKDHMGLFVQNEDKLMSDALTQSITGGSEGQCHGWNGEEDIRLGTVLPMSEDIFVFIKESLKRALRISQQEVLVEIAGVWRSHLLQFTASVMGVLPSPAVTPLDVRRACIVVNTADFCQATSQDLGNEVCARCEAPPKQMAFGEVVDAFSALYSRAIQAIVQGVNLRLAVILQDYGSGSFMANRDNDGMQDESPLVRSMGTVLHDLVLNCAAVLPATVLRYLLDKVAASVIPKYTNLLYRLRRLPEDAVGAMRIDSASLEKTFLQLPNYNDPERFQPVALTGYIRLVRREFDQLNRTLKVLQVDARGDAFLDVYFEVTLPEDRSIQNFVRLVELKGLRREEVRPSIAALSKRGVVEATRRDIAREEALGIATGTGASPPAGAGTGLRFGGFFSRDAAPTGESPEQFSTATNIFSAFVNSIGSPSSGAIQPIPATTTAPTAGTAPAGDGRLPEESLGSRFANAARSTATSINFLNKFKKSDGK